MYKKVLNSCSFQLALQRAVLPCCKMSLPLPLLSPLFLSACSLVDGAGSSVGLTLYGLAVSTNLSTGDILTIPDPHFKCVDIDSDKVCVASSRVLVHTPHTHTHTTCAHAHAHTPHVHTHTHVCT